jgi:predicted  nucleic acid-binding Zn-ribbon protein
LPNAHAEAGDRETLARLSQRNVAIEAEYVAANTADNRAQIELFEVELSEASAKAATLTDALPKKVAQLKEEREDLQNRLEENGNAMHRVTIEEVKARRVVDELRAKIAGAQQALSRYIKESAERAAA